MSSLRRAFISYNVCASTTTATFETWQQIAARRSSKQTKKSNQFFRLAWRFSHISTARATIQNEHLITETIFNKCVKQHCCCLILRKFVCLLCYFWWNNSWKTSLLLLLLIQCAKISWRNTMKVKNLCIRTANKWNQNLWINKSNNNWCN